MNNTNTDKEPTWEEEIEAVVEHIINSRSLLVGKILISKLLKAYIKNPTSIR